MDERGREGTETGANLRHDELLDHLRNGPSAREQAPK